MGGVTETHLGLHTHARAGKTFAIIWPSCIYIVKPYGFNKYYSKILVTESEAPRDGASFLEVCGGGSPCCGVFYNYLNNYKNYNYNNNDDNNKGRRHHGDRNSWRFPPCKTQLGLSVMGRAGRGGGAIYAEIAR